PAWASDDEILVPEDAPIEVNSDSESAVSPSPPQSDLGTTDATDRLVVLLRSHDSFKVRTTVAVSLGRMGDARASAALAQALTLDPHYAVRAGCASALGRIGDGAAIHPLLRALADIDPIVRAEAGTALRAFHTERYLVFFQEAVTSPHAAERRAAVQAFGANLLSAPERGATVVLEALADEDGDVRAEATRAIEGLTRSARAQMLQNALGHKRSTVRAAGGRLLARWPDPEAVPTLLEAICRSEEPTEVRDALREAVRAHREFLEVGALLVRAGDPALGSSEDRLEALSVVGAFGGQSAERVLRSALGDRDVRVRSRAARAAGDLDGDSARALLGAALAQEQDARVKRQMELVLRTIR
ncbi:MAG: HEAT repeat domain-containing protein, partial [Myxococcota bacterium]